MKAVFKAANREQEGRGGSRPAGGGPATTGQHASKKISLKLTPPEMTFLLTLLRPYREYYGLLAGNSQCGTTNRRKHAEIEGLAQKLENGNRTMRQDGGQN
jgi:hypothetical protein